MTSPHENRGLLAMYAGLRLGEACAITRLDLAGDRLRVDKQVQALRETGKPTIVRLTDTKSRADDVVVPWWLTERVLGITETAKPDGVRESVKRAFRRVGCGHLTFHSLRHWYATTLLERGAPLSLVSRQLRHSDVVVTLRHYSEHRQSQIHDLLG
jgi:integrase